ncbi:MAG: nucleotide sugar dehydrogenase [Desulfobaccales bacterium]
MRISVFGLGKLGLCTAACLAVTGHQVTGFDANPQVLAALQAGQNPIQETGLDELLIRARPNLKFSHDPKAIVRDTEISLIIVPTPSLPDGRFSTRSVEAVLGSIGPVLRHKNTFHVVAVVSTVMPGSGDQIFKPLLEGFSGKTCGRDFGLVYNPEFIALGSVIHNFLNPDLVLIGASDARAGNLIRELYRSSCHSQAHIAVMSLINAEITKLSLNCFVTMKISFANELAALCEQVPGAEADVITQALGADSRIGGKGLKSGLGFGGPCFPRDNLAFQAFAQETGHEVRLAPQVVKVNQGIPERLARLLRRQVRADSPIALLGLAYKPETPVVEESQAVILAQALAKAGFKVQVHDPQALDQAREVLGDKVKYGATPHACVQDAAAVVLLTNWPQYARLDWPALATLAGPAPLLLDCWGTLRGKDVGSFRYRCLGMGPEAPQEEPLYEPAANL